MLDRVAGFLAGQGAQFRTEAGRPVRVISRLPQGVSLDYVGLTVPRRLITAAPETSLRAGMLLIDAAGVRYLLGRWPADTFFGQVVAEQYVLLECNAHLTWSRLVTEIDPVSGLTRAEGVQSLGRVWAVSERRNVEMSAGGFDSYTRRVVCGADLQAGDSLDDQMVKRVDRSQGLTIADLA